MWWHTRRNQISSFGEMGRGRHFSRLQATEVCTSAVLMLDTPLSEVVWRVLATHCIRQFPLHFPSHVSPCAITFQLESSYMSRQSIFRPVFTRRYLHYSILDQITKKLCHGGGDITRRKQINNLNKHSKVKDELIRYCLFRTDWLISYLILTSNDTASQLRTTRFCDICVVRA
jgi:hypothetical protein